MTSSGLCWQPSTEAYAEEACAFAAKIKTLLIRSAGGISPGLRDCAVASLDSLDAIPSPKGHAVCSPDVLSAYFLVKDAFSSTSSQAQIALRLHSEIESLPARVAESLSRAETNRKILAIPFDLSTADAGVSRSLNRGANEVERLGSTGVKLTALAKLAPEVITRISTALRIIQEVWPEAFAEMDLAVHRLIVYQGHAVIGFTDFRYHGSIFFKLEWLLKRPSELEVAEDLIHEAAHVRLNTTIGLHPLFENDFSEIYRTPLRRDLRSMFGLFHQMYVLLRVFEFYRRGGKDAQNRRDHLRVSAAQFASAFRTVRENAQLTSAGAALVSSIEKSADIAGLI